MQISRIRLSDKTSRLRPRHVVPSLFTIGIVRQNQAAAADVAVCEGKPHRLGFISETRGKGANERSQNATIVDISSHPVAIAGRSKRSGFITDACATLTDGEHGGTLSAMAHVFCDVRDTQSMLSLIAAA
ncbi:MAG TPA: hypothetical protein VK554_07385 [Bradyrhizobium sp.]|nr:hypothetical protein [Bradyrhizobium sp.]